MSTCWGDKPCLMTFEVKSKERREGEVTDHVSVTHHIKFIFPKTKKGKTKRIEIQWSISPYTRHPWYWECPHWESPLYWGPWYHCHHFVLVLAVVLMADGRAECFLQLGNQHLPKMQVWIDAQIGHKKTSIGPNSYGWTLYYAEKESLEAFGDYGTSWGLLE